MSKKKIIYTITDEDKKDIRTRINNAIPDIHNSIIIELSVTVTRKSAKSKFATVRIEGIRQQNLPKKEIQAFFYTYKLIKPKELNGSQKQKK